MTIAAIKNALGIICEAPCVQQWWLEVSTPYDYLTDYKGKLNKLKGKELTPNAGESTLAFGLRKLDLAKTIRRLEGQIVELEKNPRPRSYARQN